MKNTYIQNIQIGSRQKNIINQMQKPQHFMFTIFTYNDGCKSFTSNFTKFKNRDLNRLIRSGVLKVNTINHSKCGLVTFYGLTKYFNNLKLKLND